MEIQIGSMKFYQIRLFPFFSFLFAPFIHSLDSDRQTEQEVDRQSENKQTQRPAVKDRLKGKNAGIT